MRAWSLVAISFLAITGCGPRAYYGYLAFDLEAGQSPPAFGEFQVGFAGQELRPVHERIGLFELDRVFDSPFIIYQGGKRLGDGQTGYQWSTRPTDPTRVVLKYDSASGNWDPVDPDTSTNAGPPGRIGLK